jgi:CHAT domain-containing protein/tetratricopeptide (TPR) repeat protein
MAVSAAEIDTDLTERLFALTSLEEQIALLDAANLLTAAGLSRLLDQAMQLARSAPARARQLTILCAAAAESAAAPAIVPRARYIQAQTYALNGELQTAYEWIQAARDGYQALGDPIQALRTNAGSMHVLNELGRHQDVINLACTTLDQLNQFDQPEARPIRAFVYHNLGVCYRRMGNYEEALRTYEMAEAAYLAVGMADRVGDIGNNRGIILLHLGRAGEALAAFEAAAAARAEAGLTLLHGQTLINIANAHLLLGHYTRSLDSLAQAQQLLAPLGAQAEEDSLRLDRADVYLALNLYPEALVAYQEVEGHFASAGMAHYRARALWGMGAALIAQARLNEAAAALTQAAALFQEAGNAPMVCTVLLEQAALQAAGGEREAALATAREALSLVRGGDWPVQQLYAHLRLADLLLPDETAEEHLLQANTLAEELLLPHLRYRTWQRLGHLRRRQGRCAEARHLLEAAVAEIERLRGGVAQEAMRVSFQADKVTAYEELVQLYLAEGGEDGVRRAFATAEQARSRALVDLLTGVVSGKGSQPADADLTARQQSLQADLNAVYNEFLSGPAISDNPTSDANWQGSQASLLARAQTLEQEITRLRLLAAPGENEAALPLETIQAQLPADCALLAYYTIGDEVMAFASINGRLQLVRGLTTVPAVQSLLQQLTVQWDRFRAGPAFVQRHQAALERSAQRILAALYDALFAPLAPFLAESGPHVAIVPHGLLHQVPFHAVFDGQQYLLERLELSYAPSATVFTLCQQRPRSTTRKALVAAVSDPLIPAVTGEAQRVAQPLPEATLLLDEQATVTALKAAATGCDLLHLACHGLFRADNPLFSALKLHDGWLTAADALQLDLPGALVTLSACESGRNQVVAGDEAVGLARAFLGAGAATLVVSLWLVQDDTTATLMADWYGRLQQEAQAGPAASLRAAQLALKEKFAHPYYWAPFMVIGRR